MSPNTLMHSTVFLFTGGVTYDLNAITTGVPTGGVITSTAAINAGGDIVGIMTIDGESHGVLLKHTGRAFRVGVKPTLTGQVAKKGKRHPAHS